MGRALGGCASIAGLTAYSNGDCNGGDCDAGPDATAEGLPGDAMPDGTTSGGQTADDATAGGGSDSTPPQDATGVTPDVGAGDAVASCDPPCPGTCTTHNNGVGQSYYDCNPLYSSSNPWTQTAATEACAALTGDSAKCAVFKCNGTSSVCSSGDVVCDCWEYSGSESGHVNASGNCDCVTASNPTWD
jgi:hypothetical protein